MLGNVANLGIRSSEFPGVYRRRYRKILCLANCVCHAPILSLSDLSIYHFYAAKKLWTHKCAIFCRTTRYCYSRFNGCGAYRTAKRKYYNLYILKHSRDAKREISQILCL